MNQNTNNSNCKTNFRAELKNISLTSVLFIFAFMISLFASPLISEKVRSAFSLSFSTIIPSIFPFMILSDFLISSMHFEEITRLRRIFSRAFKISGYAVSAFLISLISGFPIGVKLAADLYKNKKITKEECERLIGFSNNPSPAFVISGIGAALLGSIKLGVVLYIVSATASIITGILFSFGKTADNKFEKTSYIEFHLVESIKKASAATLNVVGFVTFFSVIIGLLESVIKNAYIILIISSFMEIGNAAKIITSSTVITNTFCLSALAFAINFSGICVHFQSKSLLEGSNISMKKYYIMKLSSGIIAMILINIYLLFA